MLKLKKLLEKISKNKYTKSSIILLPVVLILVLTIVFHYEKMYALAKSNNIEEQSEPIADEATITIDEGTTTQNQVATSSVTQIPESVQKQPATESVQQQTTAPTKQNEAVNKKSQETAQAPTQAQSFVSKLKVANQTDQLIIVQGNGGSGATISLHTKVNGIWSQTLSTSGNVGLNGITSNKQEGDKKTPSGVYSFGFAFGTGSNPGTSLGYRQITNDDYWVDDSNSLYYNKWVNTNEVTKNWSSAEHLASYPTQYAYAMTINYNTSCTPNKGSAIFFHCSTGSGTYGCVSVPYSVMVSILKSIHPNCLIVIDTGNNIYNY